MRFTLAPMPETPSELLAVLIAKHGEKQALADKLGTTYVTVNRWTNGKGFNDDNQRRVARALRLPEDYFASPDLAATRERQREAAFAAFTATELGKSMSDNERRTLGDVRFFGSRPTPELYASWLLSLRGMAKPDVVALDAASAEAAGEPDALDVPE